MTTPQIQTFTNKKFAKYLAKQLDEKDFVPYLDLLDEVPKRLAILALQKTERIKDPDPEIRSKAEAFMAWLRYYARIYGIKLPKQCKLQ